MTMIGWVGFVAFFVVMHLLLHRGHGTGHGHGGGCCGGHGDEHEGHDPDMADGFEDMNGIQHVERHGR